MVHAVIFDMDGVVLDSERLAMHAWQRAGKDFGFDISDDLYRKVTGLHGPDARKVFEDALGERFSYASVRERRTEYFEQAILAGLQPRPGLAEALQFLESRKLGWAIATSTKRADALHRLAVAGIGNRFPLLVGGDEVEHSKPNPEIFLRAAKLLGVPPEECIVVEDSRAGVEAGVRAGMRVVFVPDLTPPTEEIRQRCAAVIGSLAEIGGVIDEQN